jgi:YHS domain-containing protein
METEPMQTAPARATPNTIQQTVRHMLAAAVLIGLSAVASWAGNGYPRWAGSGPVIKGYDLAGYHAQGLARLGSPSHTLVWAGGTFHFASAEAAERFRAAPNRLAPRFGGYCTGGLSQGHVVDANPKLFRVYKGNLYVFASPAGPERFDRDPGGVIRAARANAQKVGVVE